MKKQVLLLLLLDLCMASCNNQDFAYNERMTSNFYSCKERLDNHHRKLFKGGFDHQPADSMAYELKRTEIRNFAVATLETKKESSLLEHSHSADAFHANVLTYMAKIAEDYTPLLLQYVDERDSTVRKALLLQLETRRDALAALEDKCQELQMAFLKKAGIKFDTEPMQHN